MTLSNVSTLSCMLRYRLIINNKIAALYRGQASIQLHACMNWLVGGPWWEIIWRSDSAFSKQHEREGERCCGRQSHSPLSDYPNIQQSQSAKSSKVVMPHSVITCPTAPPTSEGISYGEPSPHARMQWRNDSLVERIRKPRRSAKAVAWADDTLALAAFHLPKSRLWWEGGQQ